MVSIADLSEEEAMRVQQGIQNLEMATLHAIDLNIKEALAYLEVAQIMLGPLKGMRSPAWLDEDG